MSEIKNKSKEEVIASCEQYMPEDKVAMIKKACAFAERAHEVQKRKSGEPFFIHPTQVASILADLQMDPDTVATGFLHDVVEDTGITLDDIEYFFSKTIATLVDGVTKLGKVKYRSKEEQLAENHQKLLLAMANDLRVIVVKLADRLHNMRTLKWHRPEKQVSISEETLDIYAPLADRLGMSQIKWELEDTCLRYINPEAYYQIVYLMNSKREEREAYIDATIDVLNKYVKPIIDGEYDIYGRPKHIYSIYKKMHQQKKTFDEIYDLLAIRVLVPSVKDCYAVLGIVHTSWKPLPGRFKDYIAMPKANGYQSLHTTVLGEHGQPVEIQIRTFDMHEVAEYGVAAHWAYKKGVTDKVETDDLDKQLEWFHQIEDLQDDSDDATQFVESVKEDIFKDKVYVFTPKGDVSELPSGASPLDFAYQIHTEVGHSTVGAKVNGKIVPLNYGLHTGDIVEILTSKNSAGPSRDWVNFVVTNRAKNKIKRHFKLLDRDENIERGREAVIKTVKEMDFSFNELFNKDMQAKCLERFNFSSIDDLFAAVGFGELSASAVANKITENERKRRDKEEHQSKLEDFLQEEEERKNNGQSSRGGKSERMAVRHNDGIVVEGEDNVLFRLAHCCNPIPGDDIIGFITMGRGVTIHRQDCQNIQNMNEVQSQRLIEVYWEDAATHNNSYAVEIMIDGFDRNGFLNDILQVITPLVTNISNVNGNVDHKTNNLKVRIRIVIQSLDQLEKIIDRIKNVPDVYDVERV
ncbi:bifunctional (p)ppGpp synthetase/guanosine-3',5'-bis(diphosphate) 3'-pyrophosphohydrolase [Aerococcus urinae]|uniref:RelA/SpoT family protein n=1 Tax=Aerococcus urinae TaxID=1376 RepID=UPI00254B7F3E|nr:bifunctional (p)ppGpp synthetase/guanosine-3',5'-bis(diphosphate) 3'-pyrophosphohydrolase [Aerococcus urinae]MDK7194751.1 bifunctional (p)ppGpp synthetase/guanosine-3',5'-bis(diphosphate) 3'-pyrophosphohydrolase [Aerococcus urinae]MDK7920032.1 bifunctional (p)ppGpp synthetase/guanosine-3',5'-bis(diphosphate) 3'-pyrophosphohydrolase [Aerococcus urinae]